MAEFLCAYTDTLGKEGGYSNRRKTDRGGETFCGISRNHHPECKIWPLIDEHFTKGGSAKDIIGIPGIMAIIAEFYRDNFWLPLFCDKIKSQKIANELFDSGVNCGPGNAVRFLQKSLNLINKCNLKVDGAMGPKTLTEVNDCLHSEALLKAMNGFQFMHYEKLAESDSTQISNFTGWMARVWS